MNVTNILLDSAVDHYHMYKLPSEKRRINLSNHDQLLVSTIEFNIPPRHDCMVMINFVDNIQSYLEYATHSEERLERLELKMVSVISKVRNIHFEYFDTTKQDPHSHRLNWKVSFGNEG